MRDFVAGVLLMAFLLVSCVSFIALFRPLPKLRLASRKDALKGFGVALGLLVLAAIVIPEPDKAAQQVADTQAPKIANADPEQAKADTIAFYRSVMNAIRPCDEAAGKMGDAAAINDFVEVYRAAGAMDRACLPTASEIRDIDLPKSLDKEARAKLKETREVCANTYAQRWASAGKVKEALDSGGSIKSRAALADSGELQQAGMMLCVAGLMGSAMAHGANEEDLK